MQFRKNFILVNAVFSFSGFTYLVYFGLCWLQNFTEVIKNLNAKLKNILSILTIVSIITSAKDVVFFAHARLFDCWFVTRTTQKLLNRFSRNSD